MIIKSILFIDPFFLELLLEYSFKSFLKQAVDINPVPLGGLVYRIR